MKDGRINKKAKFKLTINNQNIPGNTHIARSSRQCPFFQFFVKILVDISRTLGIEACSWTQQGCINIRFVHCLNSPRKCEVLTIYQ